MKPAKYLLSLATAMLLLAVMVVPVSADAGDTTVTANLESISITAPTGQTNLLLAASTNDQSLISDNGTCSSNVSFDVTAKDSMDGKNAGDAGHLTEWTGAAWVDASKLTNAVTVWSSHASKVGAEITLTATGQDVISGASSGTDVDLLLLVQQDTAGGDVAVTGASWYKVVITFTASKHT